MLQRQPPRPATTHRESFNCAARAVVNRIVGCVNVGNEFLYNCHSTEETEVLSPIWPGIGKGIIHPIRIARGDVAAVMILIVDVGKAIIIKIKGAAPPIDKYDNRVARLCAGMCFGN